MTKTYAAKSSVTRAMKQQGIDASEYTVETDKEGKFFAKMIVKEEFHAVTEAEHKEHRGEKESSKKPRNGNCVAVWEVAEEMIGARRKDVVAACVAKGIPEGTAKTQYQHWFSSRK